MGVILTTNGDDRPVNCLGFTLVAGSGFWESTDSFNTKGEPFHWMNSWIFAKLGDGGNPLILMNDQMIYQALTDILSVLLNCQMIYQIYISGFIMFCQLKTTQAMFISMCYFFISCQSM